MRWVLYAPFFRNAHLVSLLSQRTVTANFGLLFNFLHWLQTQCFFAGGWG